jgi:transposase
MERCCGLDVHKRTVVACLLTPGKQGAPQKEVRTFGTMTADLLALAEWLAAARCTHVAMEGTGVSWLPIWNLLEDRCTLPLVNARHVKAVPGRKTDVKDAEWLADLLRHGLLRGSFVPNREQRELRELTRYRTTLLRERAAEANRLQKTLEAANLKLASVVTDITGKSGRAMLRALIAGEIEPARLAALAEDGCARRSLSWNERWSAGSARTSASSWRSSWITSTSWMSVSPKSARRSPRGRTPWLQPLRGWTPSRVSGSGQRRSWWPRSAQTWSGSQPPTTSHRGPGCARAITKVLAGS